MGISEMGANITAVINLHREGYLCKPSFESARLSVEAAYAQGITVETIVVLDRPDARTMAIAQEQSLKDWKVFAVDFGDLGQSRNFGIAQSTGDLIAFLDGDDLWCPNWLSSTFEAANSYGRPAVWHPELSIYFGAVEHVFYHPDMESEEFDLLDLCLANAWTALCCAPRQIFESIPYPSTDLDSGIGYEDWGWNLATIEYGHIHKIVPGTGHAIRKKPGNTSLLELTNQNGAVPAPSYVFKSLLS